MAITHMSRRNRLIKYANSDGIVSGGRLKSQAEAVAVVRSAESPVPPQPELPWPAVVSVVVVAIPLWLVDAAGANTMFDTPLTEG